MTRLVVSGGKGREALPLRPVLFVAGWGFDGRVLGVAAEQLPWLRLAGQLDPSAFPDQLCAWLDRQGLERIDLVGWSMGACCALEFARRYPDLLGSLTLLALRRDWPAEEIAAIRSELRRSPREYMSRFYRKCFLGYPRAYARFKAELELAYLGTVDLEQLERGLDYLESFAFESLPPVPCQVVLGGRDRIVPPAEAARADGCRSRILPQAGHALFLEPAVARLTGGDKRLIRSRFSRAAASYDQHAAIQRLAAEALAERLPAGAASWQRLLEIGCGTGSYTSRLLARCPAAMITALDFSEPMLLQAKSRLAAAGRLQFLCADGEQFLATAPAGCFDAVTANATLQWFGNLENAFAGVRRVLRPDGLFLATLFGPESLTELDRGLAAVTGGRSRVAARRFWPRSALERTLARYFQEVEVEEHWFAQEYASLRQLLLHFKYTGTSGWQPQGAGLGRGRLAELAAWFQREIGGFRLRYQLFLVRGR